MRRRLTRTVVALIMSIAAAAMIPVVASAHPLGNFTVNQYSGIVVRSDGIDVNYVLDMAEIPTAQLLSHLDSDETTLLAGAAAASYRRSECATIAKSISVYVGGAAVRLTLSANALTFPTGAAGLHTLRLTCRFKSEDASPVSHPVSYVNHNFDDRVGWREITAVGTTARLASSDVPTSSISSQLTRYPTDLLTSPLAVRSAALTAVTGSGGGLAIVAGGPTGVLSRGVDGLTSAFVGLISRQQVDPLFVALALGLALFLGGIHAFAPGHGKTLMAAYLVGQRGSLRHAAALAGSVTLTHTVGVLALGIALSVSTSFAPTSVYPILGVASGLIVVCIGLGLFARAWRLRTLRASRGDDHRPDHQHPHAEAAPAHEHGGRPHTHLPVDAQAPRLRSVLAIGFAGGMVPSPSALVVLIGGIALHRTWFAVLLVLAYGVGMALVLTGTGVVLRHARTILDRRVAARPSVRGTTLLSRLSRTVPLLTATAVIVVGVGLTLRGGSGL